jgi:hypothetical protein
MKRALMLTAAIVLLVTPGCTLDSVRRSVLGSFYCAYGDGYDSDRISNFDDRYDQQTKAAEEYYQQR